MVGELERQSKCIGIRTSIMVWCAEDGAKMDVDSEDDKPLKVIITYWAYASVFC